MNFELETVNCNLCGSSNTKLYSRVSYADYMKRRPDLKNDNDPLLMDKELARYKFNIVKCSECGLVYVNPRLSDNSLASLYGENYFSHYNGIETEAHKKRHETIGVEINELEKIINSGMILDIGCTGGFFLNALSNKWEKYGVDINELCVKYAKENFGLDVRAGILRDAAFSSESFNVVNLRGVIEHFYNPMSELIEIYRILKSGGIISILTPNIGSICAKLYRGKYRLICPTHHIYYFSIKTLSKMLTEVGFKIITSKYHYLDTPYANIKDPLQILFDIATLRMVWDYNVVSPPFHGNFVNIYARKEYL